MYNFSLLPILNLIVGAWILLMGAYLFIVRRRTYIYLTYFTTSGWILGYGFVHSALKQDVAFLWCKLVYVAVIFIAPTMYHFVVAFWKLKKQKIYVWISYFIGVIFLGILFSTPLLVKGVRKSSWGYHTVANPSFTPVFLLFFFTVYGTGLFNLYKRYIQQKREGFALEAVRTKYFLLIYFVSALGAVDFIQDYGIVDFYPLGFLFPGIGVTIAAYAIIRHKLMHINVAITRAGIFLLVYLIILGLPFVLGYKLHGTRFWITPLLIMAALATSGPFIYTYLKRKAESRIRKEEFAVHRNLSSLTRNMLRFTNTQALLELITDELAKIMKLESASIYLNEQNTNHYFLRATQSVNNKPPKQTEFLEGSNLVKDIISRKMPIMSEELKFNQSYGASFHVGKIQNEVLELDIAVVIPAFKGDILFGFFTLGPKTGNRFFTQEDINLLSLLANQMVLAIENAQLAEREKFLLAQKSRRDALSDMAPGVAHQFDNRLQGICLVAETQMLVNEQQDIEKAGREELLSLVKQSQDALSAIVKDAVKGREIADAVRKKGRAKLEYEKQQLLPIIQSAVNRLKISRTEESLQGAAEPEITIDAQENLPELLLKQSQTDDVFYNLVDNARDAIILKHTYMRDGMLTKEEDPYKGRIILTARKQGDYIAITVSDNGIGMKDKELRRLFVPWFTTKATSVKGTGMGLNSIRAVIEDHKGRISVESEYGKGTNFTIRFPVPGE